MCDPRVDTQALPTKHLIGTGREIWQGGYTVDRNRACSYTVEKRFKQLVKKLDQICIIQVENICQFQLKSYKVKLLYLIVSVQQLYHAFFFHFKGNTTKDTFVLIFDLYCVTVIAL